VFAVLGEAVGLGRFRYNWCRTKLLQCYLFENERLAFWRMHSPPKPSNLPGPLTLRSSFNAGIITSHRPPLGHPANRYNKGSVLRGDFVSQS